MTLRVLLAFGISAVAALGAVAAIAQQQGGEATPPDVVVTGRADGKLSAGLWEIHLSRSYAYGQTSNTNERFAAGHEQTYRFCLPDTQVEVVARALTGEGRSSTMGATQCSALAIETGRGKLIARQSCSGLTIPKPTAPTSLIESESATAIDTCGWRRSTAQSVPATSKLSVQGRYSADRLQLDFLDERQPVCLDPSYQSRPYGRQWTISGSRIGDCTTAKAEAQPKP
ncbi:hypothetical protein GGQ80_001216 [Sphingomonas jinjuensis]|uniref:RICIN domain-containing protein n=1 Tax=Sphingomonas jinjuensis TaxID=535907 RepID=A0A840FC12_9SPHN|nr:hypothetical protein [Sphingomonas jinjuensis]MBB4153314.1 hypothetical protein [Sphingomonas jinjuensis]